MANLYFNEKVLFQLPSDFTYDREVDDNGDEFFKIQTGKYTNDDGETDYEFCCFASLVKYDPNNIDDATKKRIIEFDKETKDSRIIKLLEIPKVYLNSLFESRSIFGSLIKSFELSGQIRLSECSLLELVARKVSFDDETIDELSMIQKFLRVLSFVIIDGKKLPLESISASEIFESLKTDGEIEAKDISPKIQFNINFNGEETTHEFYYDGKKQSSEHADLDEQVNQELKTATSCGIWFMLGKIVSMCKNTSYFTEDEIEIIEAGLTFHESLLSEVLQRDSEMYEAALLSNKNATNTIMSIAADNGKAAISIFEKAMDKWIPPCFEKAFTLIALFFDIPYAPANSLPIEKKREIMQDCRGFVNSMQVTIAMANIGVQYTAPDYCDADSVSVTHTRNNTVVAINANEKNKIASKKAHTNILTSFKGASGEVIEVESLEEGELKLSGSTLERFYGFNNKKRIYTPEGITEIGHFAFFHNQELECVMVSEGVKKISDGAFQGCRNLKYVQLPNTLEEIDDRAFEGCDSLRYVIIPDNVKRMGIDAFNCKGLEYVYVPSSVKTVEAGNFWGNESCILHVTKSSEADKYVHTVYMSSGRIVYTKPEGVPYPVEFKKIVSSSDEPKTITDDGGFTVISRDSPNAFVKGKTLQNIVGNEKPEKIIISGDFKIVGSYAGGFDNKIKSLIISEGVTDLNKGCFSGSKKLEEVSLPKTLIKIGANAFSWCDSLKEIRIPESVTTIGAGAFEGCKNLKTVYFPKSIQKISGKWQFTPDDIVFFLSKDSVAEEFVKKNYKKAEIRYI